MGFYAARIETAATRVLGVALTGLVACSTAGAAPGTPQDAGPPDGGSESGPGEGLTVAMGATLKPGDDVYRCKYVAMSRGADAFFVGAEHRYGDGCHHLLVFQTDLTAIPSGQDSERDCFAPDDVMQHARAQIYGAQTNADAFSMPAGAGLPLVPGAVLLVQMHYLNATAAPVDASAAVTIHTTTAAVSQRAGAFYFADPFIDIGAGQRARAAMRCSFPGAATLLAVSGYAHARATDFSAFVDPPGAPPAASTFYRAPGEANPLPLKTSVPVPAGSHVRFGCTFDNARGQAEVLGGPRDDADEACVLSGLYVPDLGADVSACRAAPGGFGTGAATCAQTRACVDACPAAVAPPGDLGLGTGAAADPCWQRCVVASCSDASQLLLAVRACIAASCAQACMGDAGGACDACTQSGCASEVAACAADACP